MMNLGILFGSSQIRSIFLGQFCTVYGFFLGSRDRIGIFCGGCKLSFFFFGGGGVCGILMMFFVGMLGPSLRIKKN